MGQWYQELMSRLATRGFVSALVALAAVAAPLVMAPLLIYSANVMEFGVSIRHMLPSLIWVAAVALLAVWLILMSIPHRSFDYLLAVVLAFAVLFWVQGHLLVWDYGVLDGREIDWWTEWHRGMVDGAIWLTVIVGFLFYACRIRPHAGLVAVLLIGIQAIPLSHAITQLSEPPGFHRYTADETHKFEFSRDRNIILVVLDAFQADVMQEILEERPKYYELFDGFVFYRNAVSGYPRTYPAIPLILTGRWYENDVPIQEFVRAAFESSSVTKALMQNGWRVDVFPLSPQTIHWAENIADNMTLKINIVTRAKEVGRLLDSGLFRSSPHFFKFFWLNNYQWRFSAWFAGLAEPQKNVSNETLGIKHPHDAVRLVKEMDAYKTSSFDVPTFKMYHLPLPHAPFILNEELEVERLPPGRMGFLRHSVAALEIVRHMLDQLRELNLYDETMVIIVSDHGGGNYGVGVKHDLLPERIGQPDVNHWNIAPHQLASALPLILIKPFKSGGKLEIVDTAVSLGDVTATIAAAAAVPENYEGHNILTLSEQEERVRRYLFYHWHDEYLLERYMPRMVEYEVRGHSWLPQNWQVTGRMVGPTEIDASATAQRDPPSYRFGELMWFTSIAPHSSWLEFGWSVPGSYGTWSDGSLAVLRVPLATPSEGALEARFQFWPFTVEHKLTAQLVRLRVNGYLIGEQEVTTTGWYKFLLPHHVTKKGKELEFRFELPRARSPNADMAIGADVRTLGVALMAMEILPRQHYELGEPVVFGHEGNAQCCSVSGWSFPEAGFTWTEGHRAVLEFVLRDDMTRENRDLLLKATIFPHLGRQIVNLYVNGSKVGLWDVRTERNYEARIPIALLNSNRLQIDFEIPGAIAPSAVTDSSDGRKLGIAARTMMLRFVE